MIWLMFACTTEPTVTTAEPVAPVASVKAPAADPMEVARTAAAAKAESAASTLTTALKGTLTDAMSQGGPETAVSACADQAQGTAALALAGKRARAGRTSTRLRSPANKAPDWVVPWLEAHGDGALADAKPETTFTESDGHLTARIIRPIEVKPLCLSCHGDAATIPPEVAAILTERYPDDAATGYAVGDLRGAVWAEATVAVGGTP
ncbi:MAG: hypothetical protein ACI8RZ_007196 [Myxococcota bacterium]|jgi:hypothetical protein